MAIVDDCIHYYKLDEVSGSVLDSAGTTHGTNSGATPNQTGKINTSYLFNSTDKITGVHKVLYSAGSHSVSLWVKFSSLGEQVLYSIRTGGSGVYSILLTGGVITFRLRNDAGGTSSFINSAAIISTGNWYFITATFDSATNAQKIYVNAGDVGSGTYTGGSWDLTTVPLLGRDNADGRTLDGYLDEVGFFNVALTAVQITELYNSGNGFAYPFATPTPETPETPQTPLGTLGTRPLDKEYKDKEYIPENDFSKYGRGVKQWVD